MATRYRTKQGDTLDWICWRFYGNRTGAVELVLKHNPKLGKESAVLPSGLEITLPDFPAGERSGGINLWD